jgi:CheY-like chemotaxis protein
MLLVEDNKDLADGFAELLRLHGVHVRVAFDGPSAMAKWPQVAFAAAALTGESPKPRVLSANEQ